MTTEQPETPEMEEIHCRGAPTLEQWYQVRKLTGLESEEERHYLILLLLNFFTGATAYFDEEPGIAVGIGFADIAFFVSIFMLVRLFIWSYSSRKYRRKTAAEKRGWFTEVAWRITQSGLHYDLEEPHRRDSGFIGWPGFSHSQSTDALIILHYQDPRDSFTVLAKEWFQSDADWQRCVDLVTSSIGSQESVET